MPSRPGPDHGAAVPVAAIYGANASGKSNLLDGLRFMQAAVVQSFARWEVDSGIPRQPFRLSSECSSMPSLFVAELIIDGVPYTYGFSLDGDEVLDEWLFSYPEKRKRTLFRRVRSEITFGTTVGDLKPKLEILEELTRPNALFLSACAQVKLDPLMPVYRWFRSQLRIRTAGSFRLPRRVAEVVARYLERHPENADKLVALLTSADVGITELLVEKSEDPGRLAALTEVEAEIAEFEESVAIGDARDWAGRNERLDQLRRRRNFLVHRAAEHRVELKFVHGEEGEYFGPEDESAGTRSWLELLPMVLEALDTGHVVAVDEIDTSLHPLLTARLVGLFQDPETNPHGAQLVFTTHDTSLLGTMIGDETLRRDQIWFVDKDGKGASHLYPLTDFKPRQDQNTERRYLGGSYGAVPVLDPQDFVDAVRGR